MWKEVLLVAVLLCVVVVVGAQDARPGHPVTRSEYRLLESYAQRRSEIQKAMQVLQEDEADLTSTVRARTGLLEFSFNPKQEKGFPFGSWDAAPVVSR